MTPLFPYPVLFGDVTLSISDINIDNTPISSRVHVDEREVDLQGVERSNWESASIIVSVAAPAAEISDAADVRCFVVANCGRSNHRASVELPQDPHDVGRWSGQLEFERPYWYADAVLTAYVVATIDGEQNRVIGTSDSWTVGFDDLPNRPVNGAIKIRWVDFGNPGDGMDYLYEHRENYMFISIDIEEPQLLLNSGFDGLEQLLSDRRHRGLDRALHDQTRAAIADKTWSALFNTAIELIGDDEDGDGEPEWPSVAWQRTVLESLLDRMYQGKAPDEALREAYTTREAPGGSATLQMRLAPAAAMQARAPRLLRDGIRVMSSELETDDEGASS